MPIRALMVDVDGVVVTSPELGGWSTHLERDLGLSPARLQQAFFAPHFGDIVHGRAALRDRLAPVLAQIAPHLPAETLIAYWFKQDAHLDHGLLAQIDALRAAGLKAHLATVQEHERADYLWVRLALKDHFDAIHYAADLGWAKPSVEFFRACEARSGFAPDEIFFIDDKAANVDAAKALGWRGAVWTGEQTVMALMNQAGVWPDSDRLTSMSVSPAYRPDPKFMTLGPEFADPVRPADFPEQVLRFRNDRAAATVGLGTLTDAEWLSAFARFEALPDNQPQPLAMRYHGHQFQTYNPDLGDGRGFLFAQLREAGSGRLLDLATKGSGQTPWSRTADGRLTLKGGMREVLAAAMLEALGVPTSRAFSLVETGEALERNDEPSPTRSAVLTRLSHSHIRFGTFQRHAFEERPDNIARLVDHVVENYYPDLMGEDAAAKPGALLSAVTQASARLTARWMAAGFVHGVLNTDNMNITGESFDYGPYRFLPRNDPNFVAAYFDHSGLYAFGRQPETMFWNLRQLATCLTLVSETDPLIEALNRFSPAYRDALIESMLRRLGLRSASADADTLLVNAAFKALSTGGDRLRWEPFFFDWFGGLASEDRAMRGPRGDLYRSEEFLPFRNLLAGRDAERPERLANAYFSAPEPVELLYDEIEALWSAIADRDDWGPLNAKLAAIEAARRALA